MSVDVSAVLSVIADMMPGVLAVGTAALLVKAALLAFQFVRAAIGGGSVSGGSVDPYNNDRINALHAENGWDFSWDK
jgi:hypothetical protein